MDTYISYAVLSLIAVAMMAMIAPLTVSAETSRIHLMVNGDAGTEFEGICRLQTGEEEEEEQLEPDLPQEKFWQGESVVCEIEQLSEDGEIEVVLEKNGNRSRSRTSGAGSRIRLRIG